MITAEKVKQIENLLQAGQKTEAMNRYKNLMSNAGNDYAHWVNYSSFLHRCGQLEEAVAIAEKAIAMRPGAEGFHNLGCALKDLKRKDEAIIALKRAVHSNPDFAASQNELGSMLYQNNDALTAIDHFQIATTLSPQSFNYWTNLARARLTANRPREALSAARTAKKLEPENPAILPLFGNIFKARCDNHDISPQLFDDVQACLYAPNVNPADITLITQNLFLHQMISRTLLPQIENYRISDLEKNLQNKTLNWAALSHPVFTGMLTRTVVQNRDAEKILTTLRYHLLENFAKNTPLKPKMQSMLPFMAGLACQCFINEYVYYESDEEKELLTKLKLDSAEELAIYGCYRPLSELENAKELENKYRKEPSLKIMLTMLIKEPLEEEEIKKSLKTFTSIDDEISKLVKAQYEVHPYPRWVHTGSGKLTPLKRMMTHLYPYLPDNAFKSINVETPRTLIAGCGTGKQPIETALNFKNSDILAIDISASSLAYAIRKTREFGLKNIQYGIADLLKTRELNEQFDVIQCGGVLHHLHEPMSGWQALTDCLKPGGFMKIALYSEMARKSIVAARDFIKERGYTSSLDDIRKCREEIKSLPNHHPIKGAMSWMDFYTVSTCRDLIFHVQEHRYTPKSLKQCIEKLGLEFLGFQIPDPAIFPKYQAAYPDDPRATNLENWDDFERQNPNIFSGMYQFWLRKPD